MKRRILGEGLSTPQYAVIALWALNLGIIFYIWTTSSLSLLSGGVGGVLLALGRLVGLLVAYFALVQFMLLGRVLWIERPFGLDRLALVHRYNGYATFFALLLHSSLIVLAYSINSGTNYFQQYLVLIQQFPYVWMAVIAQFLFILVVATSAYIVRRHLKFETWYWVHLLVYAAIVLAFFHQFALGGSLNG
ncbi:MAG TPA: ferric reductase-like transmembrane domain-containing protein, partial [Candidatus Limnocylindrales bacterium]|nr:ferric reductase-like transmembrane domain-containing protein [Candidatus Limnocylindrales bacterium]